MPRKPYKTHYIYKIVNLLNDEFYVGMHSTNDLNDGYMGSGYRIKRSLKKYGKENFKMEIIDFYPNREILKEKEKEIVNQELLNDEKCLNIAFGGSGGFISPDGVKKGRRKTDEILLQKYGKNFKSEISKKFHNGLSEEDKKKYYDKISKTLKDKYENEGPWGFYGRTHTEESKEIIGMKNSINQKGEKNSQFGTCWLTNGEKNIKIKKNDIHLYPEWKLGRTILK
jgi:hypothetical protein